MRSIFKQGLIGIILPSLIVAGFNSYIFAANINPAIANVGYWYGDEDIRAVITNRLGDKVYIAPAIPNTPDLIKDIANAAVNEARSGKPALIPVNINGNHWTAIAIRKKSNGELVVFYNDSFGSPVGGSSSESGRYIEAIKGFLPTAQIIDLQVHQQNDGSSCGAFTAENLITLAIIDQANLTPEAAKEVLGKITDAKSIRLKQLAEYPFLYQEIENVELIANSIVLCNNIEASSNLMLSELSNLANITADRLGHLHLININDSTGLSGGDEALTYGVWMGANLGNGIFKSKDSNKFKHNFTGGTIGFDSKIDEDTSFGIALSSTQSNIKSKEQSSNQIATDIRSVIGSLYGSINADEQLLLRGNIEFGKIYGKSKYQSLVSTDNNFKLRGEVFGATIGVNYYVPISSFILVPAFDVAYEALKLSANQQDNFKISKTKNQKIVLTPAIGVTRIFDLNQIRIIPELTASYGVVGLNKASPISITNNNGVAMTSNKPAMSKSTAKIGSNVTFAGTMMELTLGYERILQEKYTGQEGYAKVRINF